MVQSFFRRLQCGVLFAGFYINDAIRLQSNGSQAWSKEIRALHHPHNRTAQTRENARDEQSSGTGMFYFRPPAGNLMQGSPRQPTPRQMLVDCRHPERYGASSRRAAAGDMFDLAPERIQDICLG